MVVESSLSRRRDFEITAWVVAALPAAAASWRYVRNLWIDEPQFEKWISIFGTRVTHSNKSNGSRRENEGARRRAMWLLEVVEPVAFDAPHLSHPLVILLQREA